MVDPLIETARPIPGIAWIPLALFFWGIGNSIPIFVIAYVAFFPIALNTVAGVLATDKLLVRAALTMGVSRAVIIWRVIVPGSLPNILTGMRISVAGAWMALIAAELIGAPTGLGFAIQQYGSLFETPSMLAVIIAVSLMGFCSDIALRLLQRRLTPWSTGLTIGP
jgi:ABC-type nitrate/sulfonate/bicarbonate transport system permease component